MEALDLAAVAVFVMAAVRAGSRHVAKVFRYVEGRRLLASNNDLVASDERFVLVEESLDDAEIDIVLIHGLQNSRPSIPRPTETQKDETVSWVRHNLPKTERVRILSYQYDTTLRTPEYLTRRTLLHEAVQLNTRLVHARANVGNQGRPIIFVAHSLGGILLKNALVFSEMSGRDDERSILISTAGCLFYDTPHETIPSKLSESIWATVDSILDPSQAGKPDWQRSEFLCWVGELVQQTKRFDNIAANMRRKPQYIELQGCGQKASDSLKDYIVLDTLKTCLRDLKEMDYAVGGVSKRQTGDVAAKAELPLGDGIQASKRIWIISRWRETQSVQPDIAFMKFSHFLQMISDSERPQTLHDLDPIQTCTQSGLLAHCKSNLWIKASNQALIAMCSLNRRRWGSVCHMAQQLDKIRRISGIEMPERLSGKKNLPYHLLIFSTLVEAISLWLDEPETRRFLLIIDGMPSVDSYSGPKTLSSAQTSNFELRLLLSSTLSMCGLTNNMRHVIYTIECHDTKHVHSIAAWEGCGMLSDIHAKSTFSQAWDTPPWDYRDIVMSRGGSWLEALRVVDPCPLFLFLFLSNGRNRPAIDRNWAIFTETEDLEDAVSSIDEALRHLAIRGIFHQVHEPYTDFMGIAKKEGAQRCPELRITKGEQFKPPWVASKLKYQESAMASQRHCVAKSDFKSFLVDSCPASTRSCSDMQELLIAPESNFLKPENLCKLSAYLQHSALMERDYQRQISQLLYICLSPSECFKIELISFVAEEVLLGSPTKSTVHRFRSIMRLAEGICDVRNAVTLDVFRLALALLVLEGYEGDSTTILNKLLLSLAKSSRNKKSQGETPSKEELFELFCLDCIYLVRRGHYEMTVSLLQRVLAIEQAEDKPNWSSILDAPDSVTATGDLFGEKQFSDSHYCEAQELIHHWLGAFHLSTLAIARISQEMLQVALEIIIHW